MASGSEAPLREHVYYSGRRAPGIVYGEAEHRAFQEAQSKSDNVFLLGWLVAALAVPLCLRLVDLDRGLQLSGETYFLAALAPGLLLAFIPILARRRIARQIEARPATLPPRSEAEYWRERYGQASWLGLFWPLCFVPSILLNRHWLPRALDDVMAWTLLALVAAFVPVQVYRKLKWGRKG